MPSIRTFCESRSAAVCVLLALLAAGCGKQAVPVSTQSGPLVAPPIWAGAWGASMTNAEPAVDNSGGNDQSFRFLIRPTVAGTQERVTFSNFFGTTPVTIGASRLSLGQDSSAAIDATQDASLAFAGQPAVTLAPGQIVTSDPVKIAFHFGDTLAVSVYLKGSFGPVSRHNSLFITNYRTPLSSGDQTADAAGAPFTETLTDWLLLSRLDVYGSYQGTVALFGSSTTDGFHSNYSSNQIYPTPNAAVPGQHNARLSDQLAQRLNAAGYQVGVINAGLPADTVTPDSTNKTGHVQNANDRIARDVLALPNLLSMVTYFGSIDIRSPDCKSSPAIEASTQQMVATAATAKVPVFLATIPPSAFCTNPAQPNFGPVPNPSAPYAGGATPGPENGGETQRLAFNAWVRSTGAHLPGIAGVADFDHAISDPVRPNFMLPLYNSGDNYHPNGAGYQAEAETIPLTLLIPSH